jgi:hypothetical protein
MSERPPRVPRGLLVAAGWIGAAVLAAAVTLAAVSSIGSGIFGDSTRTLDQSEIAAALASSPAATEQQTSPPTGSPTAIGSPASDPPVASATQAFDSAGGSVVARCNGRDAQVVTWTAAQGFRVEAENQQGHDVEIEFESDERDVRVRITCVDGVPTAEVDEDDDD